MENFQNIQNDSLAKNRETFIKLLHVHTQRKGVDELLTWLDTTDFFEAPASTRYHGAVAGGLCAHSIAVANHMYKLIELYCPDVYSAESATIVALFHDVCKANTYSKDTRNVKNEVTGKWEKVPCYKFDEQFAFGGHGSKSVYLVMAHGLQLRDDEAAAINGHMGMADATNMNAISSLYNSNMLAWLLHVADEAATYIDKI